VLDERVVERRARALERRRSVVRRRRRGVDLGLCCSGVSSARRSDALQDLLGAC
jgi:hypothetical protein